MPRTRNSAGATALATTFAATCISAACLCATAFAASPNGTWVRASGGEIQAFDCGGGLGLKVTKSDDPKKVGKQIMCGAKAAGAARWEGKVLNLEDGQTYTGIIEIAGNVMKLSGCVLGGIICKTEEWNRK